MARILVVDDEAPVRGMLEEFLTDPGHEVEDADGGAAALASIRARPFDVVFLDLSMPEMDGLETLRQLLAIAPHLPVVMVSGADDEHLAAEALTIGAFDYVRKPIDFDYLAKVILLKLATRS
jgi:DNA-binding NtrC family response regulator